MWRTPIGDNIVVRNTMWSLLSKGFLTVVQGAYFVLVARHLGSSNYGAFVSVLALVAVVGPFVGVGTANLLIKNVSRDRRLFAEYWGNALVMNSVSGVVILGLVLLTSRFILPRTIPTILVLLIAVSDLLLYRIAACGSVAFQAVENMGAMAKLDVLTSLFRLVAAGALAVFVVNPGPVIWAYFYLASTAAGVIVTLVFVHKHIGRPRLALHRIRPEIVEGCYFSISLSAQNIYNDIDKTALARLATLEAAGIYAAAYRIVDVLFVPIISLLTATFPRFFQHGSLGLEPSVQYAKRLMPHAIAYSGIAVIGAAIGAPLLPKILGNSYADVVEALRWLAPLMLMRSVHYFLANALTGAGYQGLRSAAQVMVAFANIGLVVWLIPLYSWRGAAWASLASDALLVLMLAAAITYLSRLSVAGAAKHRPATQASV